MGLESGDGTRGTTDGWRCSARVRRNNGVMTETEKFSLVRRYADAAECGKDGGKEVKGFI